MPFSFLTVMRSFFSQKWTTDPQLLPRQQTSPQELVTNSCRNRLCLKLEFDYAKIILEQFKWPASEKQTLQFS